MVNSLTSTLVSALTYLSLYLPVISGLYSPPYQSPRWETALDMVSGLICQGVKYRRLSGMSKLGGKGSSVWSVKRPLLSYVVLLGNNNVNHYHPLCSSFLHQIISIGLHPLVPSIEMHDI